MKETTTSVTLTPGRTTTSDNTTTRDTSAAAVTSDMPVRCSGPDGYFASLMLPGGLPGAGDLSREATRGNPNRPFKPS